jgi:hypothetical protein
MTTWRHSIWRRYFMILAVLESLKGRDHFEDLGIDGRIILK